MTGDGSLGGEIQRKTAEIDSWPAWAKPYEPSNPSVPTAPGGISSPAGPVEDSERLQAGRAPER